ncbi:MAG: Rpn family recombination-promoting nuclease/putative transposase [Candidatus Tisiphia sp.]
MLAKLQKMMELIILKEKGVIDMEKYLDPTNDSLFKKIFRDKENLKEFLNSVLDLSEMYRIKEIEFIPVEELAGIHKGRRSVFDLKVKDASGNWYIIEMQKKNETDYLKRVQYYSAHSYVGQLTEGLTHLDLLPVIVISLIKTRIFDKRVPYISIHKNIETDKRSKEDEVVMRKCFTKAVYLKNRVRSY